VTKSWRLIWESFVARASLVETYVSALNLTAVAIVSSADGWRCRIETGGTSAPAFYFKPSHADLVLLTIGLDGWTDQAPAAVAGAIERTAATVGAPIISPDALRAEAERQVAEIVERVRASNQSGGLKVWKTAYKQYRRAQIAKAEKAIPYSAYLQRVIVATMVRNVEMTGRMI
jgi:hypothetical protein